MDQLPYELAFMHKFNLHKLARLLIEDDDIRSIARVYGVEERVLGSIEDRFRRNLAALADELRSRVASRAKQSPCIVAAIGDSITSDRESWAKILNEFWKDNNQRRVIDCAVSGDTTCHVKDRFYSTVMRETFDWAVLFLGTNDCRQLDDEAHVSIVGHDEYKRNMRYFTETLLGLGKEVIVVTVPYVDNERLQAYFPEGNWVYRDELIDQTNEFLRDLSEKTGARLADLAVALQAFDGEVLEEDGIHLNRNGQLILCELLLGILP
ncbi:MAG: hypothetical protein JRH07_00385 [Deltaproteobacteria bacterium]|nr:hypothetical protein [Deltaproteobacteria bacterium]MBW2120291.1 hypothetical protein [Deltaproteobacteria bacterium]